MEVKLLLKKLEPFIAIFILIMLIVLSIGIYKHLSIQEDIKDNCGYSTNSYYCICYDSESPEAELDINSKLNKYKPNITWD